MLSLAISHFNIYCCFYLLIKQCKKCILCQNFGEGSLEQKRKGIWYLAFDASQGHLEQLWDALGMTCLCTHNKKKWYRRLEPASCWTYYVTSAHMLFRPVTDYLTRATCVHSCSITTWPSQYDHYSIIHSFFSCCPSKNKMKSNKNLHNHNYHVRIIYYSSILILHRCCKTSETFLVKLLQFPQKWCWFEFLLIFKLTSYGSKQCWPVNVQ